jgi:hypothetical protein
MFCCCKGDVVDGTELVTLRKGEKMWDQCSIIFCDNYCGKFHLGLLILYCLIIACYTAVFFSYVDTRPGSHVLCVSRLRDTFTIFTTAFAICGIFGPLVLLGLMCKKVDTIKQARKLTCIVLSIYTSVHFGAFLVALGLAFSQANVVIKAPDNASYRCDIYLNIFQDSTFSSFDITNSSKVNQTCQFWSIEKLCEIEFASFRNSVPLVTIDGTLGVYRCQPSTSMGLDLCKAFLDSTYIICMLTLVCFPLSVILLWALSFWVENTDGFWGYCKECYETWDCCICREVCTCCETYMPLLPKKSHTSSTEGGA